jgi:hypothetical protein
VGCHEHAPGQGLTGAQRRRPGLHPALAGSLCRTHPLIGMTGMTSPEIQQLGVNLPHSAL